MHRTLADDLSRLPELLQSARDFAAREVAGLAERPVAAPGQPPGHAPLPAEGAGGAGAHPGVGVRWGPRVYRAGGARARGVVHRG
ncbi:aspartate aminotransferase family protein, partial [Streptomyces diastatochromogenes]